jgi:hypothetical protein
LLDRLAFSKVTLVDEDSFSHVGLYADLKEVARTSDLAFYVPSPRGAPAAQRTLLLNLLFWEPGTSDVLADDMMPADVLMHVVWHHLGAQFLPRGGLCDLLVESIASAFDLYLVGRLLGMRPDSDFLSSQVPRMAEAAEDAGVSEEDFERLLARTAEEPELAFEQTRQLLFDASRALVSVSSPREADELLQSFERRPFGPLLHHYEWATWVLRTRLDGPSPNDEKAIELDRELRELPRSLDWLEKHWVQRTLARLHNSNLGAP